MMITTLGRAGLLSLVLLGVTMAVPPAFAAELTVVSGGPLRAALSEILPGYEAASKTTISVRYEAMGPLLAQLEAGSRESVVILSAEAMEVAARKGWIDAGSVAEIGRVGVGVGVKHGHRPLDITTPESFKAALLAAKSVIATDPTKGTSGMHFATVLSTLGIAEQMKPKLKLVDGGYGAEMVASGEIEMVVQPMTVIIPVEGVTFVGPLPGDLQKLSVYSGAVKKGADDVSAATALLAHLRSPAARAVFVRQGFEK